MPDFANFTRAVTCQGEPRRVPQFDGTVDHSIKTRFLGRTVATLEDEVAFWMGAGYDFVPLTVGFRQTIRGEKLGIMGAADVSTSLLKPAEARYNPRSEKKNTRMWAEEGAGAIRDEASFDSFPWPDPDTAYSYDTVEKLSRLLPDGARLIVNVGYIFMAPWMLMGLETFCLALAEGDPLVERVIERVGRTQERVARNLLDFDSIGAIRMPDDLGHTGGLIVAPKFLRRYIFPWHKRIGQMVRSKGLLYVYHSDGRLYDVIDDLVESGFQALHPCEPASMDILAVKQKYAGRLCVCGNINLDSTLTLGTPEEVEEEVKLRIRTVAPGGGFCCGSSNSIPEYVPFENYTAMIGAIQKYGEYPIRV